MQYLMLAGLCLWLLGCREEDTTAILTAEAMLVWAGDPALDGCGLLLEVDSSRYHVGIRQNDFIPFTEQDSSRIAVVARYALTMADSVSLGWACKLRPVTIVDIRRR